MSVVFSPKRLAAVILLAASLGARVVREEPLVEFYRIKASADSVINEFYRVWSVYHYHLSEYHDTTQALMLAQPGYPEMPEEFYEQNSVDIHWIRPGWDLDSLYGRMQAWQADFNRHVRKYHPEQDTVYLVPELPVAEGDMTDQEFTEYRIEEYGNMISDLIRELRGHLRSFHLEGAAPPELLPFLESNR